MAAGSSSKMFRRTILVLVLLGLGSVAWHAPAWWTTWNENSFRKQCQRHREARQWSQLESVAAAWTDWQPHNGGAWLFRSEAAEAQHKPSDVVRFLANVPEQDSRALPAYVEQARVLFDVLDRPREAVEVYERVLKMSPQVSIAHRRIIFFHALTQQRAKMIQSIRAALVAEREPPEAYIYLFGAHWIVFGNQYELNSKWLVHDPENETYIVARAIQVIQSGAFDNAKTASRFKDVPTAEELLTSYPKNLEVLAVLIDRAIEAGDVERVTSLLGQAPDSSQADYRFWVARGWCLSAANQLESAESAFLHALELDRFGWKVNHYLADIYRRQGRDKQVVDFERKYKSAKEIHDSITRIQDASSASRGLLETIANYARECGDLQAAEGLFSRLAKSPADSPESK